MHGQTEPRQKGGGFVLSWLTRAVSLLYRLLPLPSPTGSTAYLRMRDANAPWTSCLKCVARDVQSHFLLPMGYVKICIQINHDDGLIRVNTFFFFTVLANIVDFFLYLRCRSHDEVDVCYFVDSYFVNIVKIIRTSLCHFSNLIKVLF